MGILKEIGQFIWAVLTIWQAYMTGGIVIALLGLYERVTQKTISLRTFIIGVVTFLLVAFFLAWREQNHGMLDAQTATKTTEKKLQELTQPNFELSWASATIGEGDFEQGGQKIRIANTYIQIGILNHGAPSVIKDWKGLVRLTDGSELEGKLVLIASNVTMNQWVGKLRLPLSPSLISTWSNTPIPTGGRGVGSVICMFPAGTKAKVEGPGGALIFKFWDVAGKEYPVEIPWQKGTTTNEFGPPGVPTLPGMTGN